MLQAPMSAGAAGFLKVVMPVLAQVFGRRSVAIAVRSGGAACPKGATMCPNCQLACRDTARLR
jgi:hypothetical protein